MHVITRMDMGGSAQNTLLTCLELNPVEYETILVIGPSHESNMTPQERRIVEDRIRQAEASGVVLVRLSELVRRIDPVTDFRALLALIRLMRIYRPDIVHTHTSKAGLLGRWAAWLSGIPFIVHTPHGHIFSGHFSGLLSKIFFIAEKLTDPITDRLIALTDGEKRDYVALSLAREDKMVTIHSGVDISAFAVDKIDTPAVKAGLGIPVERVVVGALGWLLPIKGPEVLFSAMERVWKDHPDTHLVYVGKGALEDRLRERAIRQGVTAKVHLLGWREDVAKLIHSMDIVVQPSFNEGMGRVIVEAMAAGKPVVGTAVGGITDLIEDDVNGFLVPVGDDTALAAAISRLAADPVMREEMGKAGAVRARQYDVAGMVRKVEALYRDVVSNMEGRTKGGKADE